MNTLTKPQVEVPAQDIFLFIKCYSAFERLPLKQGYSLIRDALSTYPGHDWQVSHLCDHWNWKDRKFGEFWLNLDYKLTMCFLKHWGFQMEGASRFLTFLASDPLAALYAYQYQPALMVALRDTIMFFENHGIDEGTASMVDLPALPDIEMRFGNASNWAEYLLSFSPHMHAELHQVLCNIRDYYPNQRDAK